MANVFDYLDWRGDIRFDQVSFNVVDGLILSLLSYVDFTGIVPAAFSEKPVTIAEASRQFFSTGADQKMIASRMFVAEKYVRLIRVLGESRRFCDLCLAGHINSFDPDAQKQFSAITVYVPEPDIEPQPGANPAPAIKPLQKFFRTLLGLSKTSQSLPGTTETGQTPLGRPETSGLNYIAFRGTDNTLVGWKEDFNMSFLSAVPAQLEAKSYLQQAAAFRLGKLYLGGHSKGGNLASFAAAFCPAGIQARIEQVHSFDGPGFSEDTLNSEGFRNVVGRIHKYLPQSSIVGTLLGQDEAHTVVHSTESGFNQHDAFSWEVTRDGFVCLDGLTDGSKFIDRTMSDWLKSLDEAQRQKFIDAFYDALVATRAETVADLMSDWFKNTRTMLKSLHQNDPETRELLSHGIQLLISSAKSNLPDINPVRQLSEHFRKPKDAANPDG